MNTTHDVRKDWFMNQHFSEKQLQQIYEWEEKSGKIVNVVPTEEGFTIYHIEDREKSIDLCFMKEEYMLRRWVERLGYKTSDRKTSQQFEDEHGIKDPKPIPSKEIFRVDATSIALSENNKFFIVSGDYALVAKRTSSNAYTISMLTREEYAEHLKNENKI